MQSVIEKNWSFGFFGKIKTTTISNTESIQKMFNIDEINTIELSILLFTDQLNKTNLEKHIKTLENISYQENSKEENKRNRLHNLFSKILLYINYSPKVESNNRLS